MIQCKHKTYKHAQVRDHLKPVNSAAIDQSWELPEPVSECITNRTHAQQNVKVSFTTIHKEIEQCQRRKFSILIVSFGLGCWANTLKKKKDRIQTDQGRFTLKTELHINFICTCKALTRLFAGNPYRMIFFKAEIPMTKMGKGKLQFFITCT